MHRDYLTSGPMAHLGFSREELQLYNFTDQELMDIFDPSVAREIALKRDELVAARLVWRNFGRFFAVVVALMVLFVWWLFTA